MQINEFIEEIKKLGVEINNDQLHQLEIYYNELVAYNSHTNLTSIIKKEDVYLKHFYDSLTLSKAIDFNNINNIIDIGTGAGFPGVIIKIFYPQIKLTLLDSNNKKTKFLELLVEKLNLNNVTIINDRAEIYAKNNQNKYDLCVSRAVAFIDIITSLSTPLIKEDGQVILMKGSINNEKSILDNHLSELNIKSYKVINFNLPITNDERNLIILNKKESHNKILEYNQILKRNKKWNS